MNAAKPRPLERTSGSVPILLSDPIAAGFQLVPERRKLHGGHEQSVPEVFESAASPGNVAARPAAIDLLLHIQIVLRDRLADIGAAGGAKDFALNLLLHRVIQSDHRGIS